MAETGNQKVIRTDVMQDASEIVHYDQIGLPLYIRKGRLSSYPDMRALCHWHEDIEWIHVLEGEMYYLINGKRVHLKAQDCLMVNARQMHYGYSVNRRECIFTCILCHPLLLAPSPLLYDNYISPVLKNNSLEYLIFPSSDPFSQKIKTSLASVLEVKEEGEQGYELEVLGILSQVWRHILKKEGVLPVQKRKGQEEKPVSDLSIQRAMVSYICQHYGEKLSLEDIARSGNVGRSKCCSVFRQYLQQSPIDFLNHYRLKASCHLLKNTAMSITQIALSCGFVHLSYYSKLFLRCYGCTPGEYRKTARLREIL